MDDPKSNNQTLVSEKMTTQKDKNEKQDRKKSKNKKQQSTTYNFLANEVILGKAALSPTMQQFDG